MTQKGKAITLLTIGTAFWGMTFAFTKEALNDIDAYSFLAFRFLLASVTLALVFYKRLKNINFQILYKGLLLSIPLCLAFITQTIGLEYTSALNAGFLTALAIVIVPFLVAIYKRALPSFKTLVTIGIATIGLFLITGTSIQSFNFGDLLMLLCALAFAIYIVLVSLESGKVDSILLTLVQLVVVSLFSILMALLNDGLKVPSSTDSWIGIVFCALFATTFMYTVQNHYQQYLSTTTTVVIFSLEPLFAAITAFVVLSETITISIIGGGVLIIGSMLMSEMKFKKAIFSKSN